MQPLDRSLRRELERTIQKARDIAESAAQTALNQLGVAEPKPYDYLSEAERDLRRRLRVHGRQLGDERQGIGTQETTRLLEEVAYQHWHRMLFARFLAENHLLMYPDPVDPVPVTLAECEDLAESEGLKNGWEVAARYAGKMLPQIFRAESPVFELILPPEYQQQMEKLLADLSPEVFIAQDSLGWVYQFWQAKRKDEVNASEVKIGARELPAVTQLFTEPYMVSFLLDNSLGAWWAARRLNEDDLQNATSEAELRQKACIDGVSLDYLRFVQDEETGAWTPAAGTFDSWPETLAELKTLDPCCGSGHFLVAALLMLTPMRAELEGLSPQEAVDSVLRQNIHGLELDQRCVEIAAFALALEAWRYEGAGGYRPLPELNLACSGLSISAKREDWVALAGNNRNLAIALDDLYQQFSDAPTLGSLINPESSLQEGTLFELKWEEVRPLLTEATKTEKGFETSEMGIVAQGVAHAASILSNKYQLVFTNVPYLGRGKHSSDLMMFLEDNYPDGKHDLAYAFLSRCLHYNISSGSVAVVLPENWMYINPCTNLREELLKNSIFQMLARLGSGAFTTISGEVVRPILFILSRNKPIDNSVFWGLDAWNEQSIDKKSLFLANSQPERTYQSRQLSNPDMRISLSDIEQGNLLKAFAEGLHGQGTFDKSRFTLQFWEIPKISNGWIPQQSTPTERNHEDYGASQIFRWEDGKGMLFEFMEEKKKFGYSSGKWRAGVNIWGENGVAISGMGYLYVRPYLGMAFDENIAVIHPTHDDDLVPIYAYAQSDEFTQNLRLIDSNLKASCNTLVKVNYQPSKWRKIATEQYPQGIPLPFSNLANQWVFHGHPVPSEHTLHVAVARLLGYRWPAELDDEMELSTESREWVARSAELLSFADKDGIVCIPSVRGERPAAERLLNLLATAYGDNWNNDVLGQLLTSVDHAGKTLETWLRDKFFAQHCAMFNHRPFIWHIWDGLRDGFSVLVNYHKLDYKGLETLIYTYLGDWISRQKSEIAQGVDGAQEKLAAAEALKKRLEQILTGESPHDIFIRWKPLEEQPIGWHPDLNDGVLINIRPFMTVQDIGKKGTGVLRDKPNVKWNKDRGSDVETAPWYHLGEQYGGKKGDRINDHHLTLAEKQAARAKKA